MMYYLCFCSDIDVVTMFSLCFCSDIDVVTMFCLCFCSDIDVVTMFCLCFSTDVASGLQSLHFESCVWRAVSSCSSHQPQVVINLACMCTTVA